MVDHTVMDRRLVERTFVLELYLMQGQLEAEMFFYTAATALSIAQANELRSVFRIPRHMWSEYDFI